MLYILNTSGNPFGDFDVLDTDRDSIKGGELMVLGEAPRINTSTERAAADVLDGYIADQVDIGTPTATRVVAKIANETSETFDMFYLADDGTTNYGTLFGVLTGQTAGLVTATANLGPHTAAGSGKVTLWGTPGLFAVSTDNVDDLLNPANTNLNDTPLPGTVLYRNTSGLLTTATATGDKVGAFVELADNGSMVNTPARLVGASTVFDRVKFHYFGAHHNA